MIPGQPAQDFGTKTNRRKNAKVGSSRCDGRTAERAVPTI